MMSETKQRNRGRYKTKKAECFAIASGRQLGIFFGEKEMLSNTIGVTKRQVKSFAGVAAAETYLRQEGLVPMDGSSVGWLSTKKSPILYRRLSVDGSEDCDNASPFQMKGAKRPFCESDSTNDAISTSISSQSAKPITSTRNSLKDRQFPNNQISETQAEGSAGPTTGKRLKQCTNVVLENHADSCEEVTAGKQTQPSAGSGSIIEFDSIQQKAIEAGKIVYVRRIFIPISNDMTKDRYVAVVSLPNAFVFV